MICFPAFKVYFPHSWAWRRPHLPHDCVRSLEGVLGDFLLYCCPSFMPRTILLLDSIDFNCAFDSSYVLEISISLTSDRSLPTFISFSSNFVRICTSQILSLIFSSGSLKAQPLASRFKSVTNCSIVSALPWTGVVKFISGKHWVRFWFKVCIKPLEVSF